MGMVVLERPTSVTTYMKIKSQNLKLITSSCTEISAILSDSGKTVHCNFKLLIPCLPNFSCRIAPDSERAKVLREATLFKIKENSCCPRMLYKPLIDFAAIFFKMMFSLMERYFLLTDLGNIPEIYQYSSAIFGIKSSTSF